MEHDSKILFIDDEPGSRESLSLLLKRQGYDVDAVAAGEEAIKLLSRKNMRGRKGASRARFI